MVNYPHFNGTPQNESDWFKALMNLARFLRSPDGCPWDRKQSSQNFAKFLEEEVREIIEAFESGDNNHIEEEVGDTLFCLLASLAAAEAEGRFTLESTLKRIHEKMIRRHEHVFGDVKASTLQDAVDSWNRIKKQEKAQKNRI